MSMPLYGLLLFMGVQTGAAQQPAAKPANTCTVEGTVLAADSGQPLRKAWVSLSKTEGREAPAGAVTDASGRFTIKYVEPARYYLFASRTGYVRQQYGQRDSDSSGTILALSPGQHARDVSFRLIRAAAISGRIYDEDSEPIQNADVQALRYRYVNGQRQLAGGGFARTNDLGEYRLFGLAPGQYYVRADYNPRQFGDDAAGNTYAPAYYPGSGDPSDATPVALRAGDDFPGVDFSLQPVRNVSISGRVFNAITGQPGAGANVYLIPRTRNPMTSYTFSMQNYVRDSQGGFKLEGVLPGSYYLVGMVTVEGKRFVSRQPVEVGDSDVQGVNLVIGPGITLKGRLHVEGKADVSGAQIWLNPRDQQISFGNTTDTVRPDGSFGLTNVADGSYEVNVFRLPEDAYVKSARLGNEDVLVSGIEITSGQAAGPLEIVVEANGGRVDGSVGKDGKPFSGVTVVLVPEDAAMHKDERWFKQTTTDQYGNFTLRGIRPGDYKIFAWEKIEPGAYQDPNFLRRYEDQGIAVRIEDGSRQTLQLALIGEDQSQ